MLRDAQRSRGAAEVPVLGHRGEVSDQSQVEVHDPQCRISHELTVVLECLGVRGRHDA